MGDLKVVSFPDYSKCIQLHLEYCTTPKVINHAILTTQTALKIAHQIKNRNTFVNCELILAGAMLHDLGRSKSHRLDHGIIGAKILLQKGFPVELSKFAENHIFGGISNQDAVELGLPARDYLPLTLEEKIVTYSDNISKNNGLLTTQEVIKQFMRFFESEHPIIIRAKKLHEYIEKMLIE
jgi:uncharacterized protein